MRCVFCEFSVCAACFSGDYLITLLSCLPPSNARLASSAVGVGWTERINVNIYCCVWSCLTCVVGDIDYVVVIK